MKTFSGTAIAVLAFGCTMFASSSPSSAEPSEASAPLVLRGSYAASAQFAPPTPNKIGRRCITPTFKWMVATNAPDSMFMGRAVVKQGGKVYGSVSHTRFSVNRWQGLPVSKPVCNPGKFTVTVRGKVVDEIYEYSGIVHAKVSGARTYVIHSAS